MSWMTLTSMYLIRNHQHPPSMDFKYRRFLTHFQFCYRAKIQYQSQESNIRMIHGVMEDPVLQVPGQEPAMSSKHGLEVYEVLDMLPILLRALKSGTNVKNPRSGGFMMSWMTLSSQVPGQEPPTSFHMDVKDRGFFTHF